MASILLTVNCICLNTPKIVNKKLGLQTPKPKAHARDGGSFKILSMAESIATSGRETQYRPGYNFRPDIWKHRLASIPLFDQDKLEWYDKEVELLKSKVEAMLKDTSGRTREAAERIKLIDILCRLGISHHFRDEIKRQLYQILDWDIKFLDKKDYDLYTVATVFRVFRQHGIKISCDVFNKFKDSEKKRFKDSIINDPKGLLSLFEAAHLSTHGEEILEEALAFTTTHLELLAKSKPDMEDEITSSLAIPLHKGPPRIKAREFISFYEKHHQNYEPQSDVLLKFAKLDFNRIQLIHQQEMRSIYKWSKEVDLSSKLPLGRDRILEFYSSSVCTYFEPEYACAREKYTKVFYLLTFLDDVYDTYGDFDDLPALSDAMDRWNRCMIEQLPRDYMKHLYKVILDTFDDFENHAARDGTSMAVTLTKDHLQEVVRAFMVEAKWIENGYLPSFQESLELGTISIGKSIVPAMTFLGMEGDNSNNLTLQAFQWLQNDPGLAESVSVIVRLLSDVSSHKREEECGNACNPYSSYKREYLKSSDEETLTEYRRIISNTWKTVNEELMRETSKRGVPLEILMKVINYARATEVYCKDGSEGLIDTQCLETVITSLCFDPIPL